MTLRRQSMVCLDFGRDQLTALEVIDGSVTRWGGRPLPDDALRNGDPVAPGYLAEAIRAVTARAGIQAKRARIALPDEVTVSRQLILPQMSRSDLARAMHFAAEKHIPFAIERARWSWDAIDRGRKGITVYLVAAWRDVVERYAEVVRGAGLVPDVLEPRAVAVARVLDQDQALVLDAGERRFHATLLLTGQPSYVDEVVVGTVVDDQREAVDRLLQRAYRHQSTVAGKAGRLAPVLLAGELEYAEIELPVNGRPVSEVLNGRLPRTPGRFRRGAFLANLGLSMRPAR